MKKILNCTDCRYKDISKGNSPCSNCINNCGSKECFEPILPKEEINHPDRYAGGKFECIDVMADVFGEEAVKDFCLLNAFKYIWRQEKKGGVEDVKKAVWYLNKYIELSDSHENV